MQPKIDSLESQRLLLEPRKEAHAIELFDFFCEPDLYTFIKREIPTSREIFAQSFKFLEGLISKDGLAIYLAWIGKKKDTQEPVGLFEISIENRIAYIAYSVFASQRGQGYCNEAVSVMMGFVKDNYNVSKFIIEMDTRNRGSTKVAEKLGFEFVKVINNATFIREYVSHEFQFQKLV